MVRATSHYRHPEKKFTSRYFCQYLQQAWLAGHNQNSCKHKPSALSFSAWSAPSRVDDDAGMAPDSIHSLSAGRFGSTSRCQGPSQRLSWLSWGCALARAGSLCLHSGRRGFAGFVAGRTAAKRATMGPSGELLPLPSLHSHLQLIFFGTELTLPWAMHGLHHECICDF